MRLAFVLACGAALMAPAASPSAPRPAAFEDAVSPQARLDALMREYWEFSLRTNPEMATSVGDPRYNDQLSDYSAAGIQRQLEVKRSFLQRAESFHAEELGPDGRVDRQLLIWTLKDELDGAAFKPWEMPLSQMSGLHIDFPQLFSSQPFNTFKDYQDYAARLHGFRKAMDDTLANLKAGLKDHLVPCKLVVQDLLDQVKPMTDGESAKAPFLEPLKHFPESLTAKQKRQIRNDVEQAIETEITPAYERLYSFLRRDYLPAAPEQPGIGQLPDGAARYAYEVRHHTTTELTPAQIHEIGLKEVARIEGEMLAIAKKQGYADLASFRAAVAKDAKLHPKDAAALVARYKGYVDGMRPELPKLFGRLPKAQLIVVPMESFRAEGAAAADYFTGTPDGSRPGRFNVNTFQAESRSMLSCESTAYHEAIPGHHLQLSIAQELEGLPDFRKHLSVTAYEEGWALYSERLGKEVGFYQDPISDYGRLGDEMLRAIRLVLDTGVHAMGWSRQQMVDFFHAHGTNDEVELQSETDRYIAWPGQALAYKVGQLTILRLREKAKAALGDAFDIRAFHDQVLGSGALPMDVLEARIDAWIAAKKK